MFTYSDDTHPNLMTLNIAITVKHILLCDACNDCKRTEDFGTQKKILKHKFAKLTRNNKPDVEDSECQLLCKHTH